MSNKRNIKNKHLAPSQDFFALGGSSNQPNPGLSQNLVKLPAKRNETSFQAPALSAKRPKLSTAIQPSGNVIPSSSIASIPTSHSVIRSTSSSSNILKTSWEERAIVVPAKDLKDKVLEYDESDSEEMIERLLCGAAKQLREQKNKPDSCLVLSLIYLAKIRPLFFCSNTIVDAFSSLLRRDSLINFIKTKNSLVPSLVVNLFKYAFHDENSWPENFIKMYIEDSLGDRVWVDNDECKEFVDIIIASFKTKLPPKSMLQTSDVTNTSKLPESAVLTSMGDDSLGEDASCSSTPSIYSDQGKDSGSLNAPITSRYSDNEEFVIRYVTDVISDHLNRRPIADISRNVIKLLMATAGIRNIRYLVIQKLEPWFQNPKLSRPAQDLLLTICLNCNESDVETLNHLLKMRLKNKAFINHFVICFKELLNKEDNTFDILLRHVVSNELAQNRNMNNLHLISIIFQHKPDRAVMVLARIFISIIFKKEDYLRALRSLLREIVRQLRYEHINFALFVDILLSESKFQSEKMEFAQIDEDIRIKVPSIVVDLITMTILLSVNPTVREAFSTSKPDRREIIRNFQLQISLIQCKTVEWLHETVIRRYPTENLRKSFISCLNKIFFFENLEQYYKIDNWPPENDRNFLFRVTTEVPILEGTLLNIFSMGSTKDIPLTPHESCDISYSLILRAAAIYTDADLNYPVFIINDHLQLIKKLFDSCMYSYPENTSFPPGYTPPNYAIIDLYWKVWFQLLILCAHLPNNFGKYAWDHFPTIRLLIELAITNNYQYPPKNNDDLLGKDMQLTQIEKIKILEFENYLAGNHEVNETNSYLIPTLITLDPTSIARRPTSVFLEDLKSKCLKYRICQLLYQSRDPDFLLIIIDQQQKLFASQTLFSSISWLVELVESNENNFSILPIPCLCEFLFGQISDELHSLSANIENNKTEKMKRKEKRRKHIRLIAHFQNLIQQNSSDELHELLVFLSNRLSSFQPVARKLAYKTLHTIVSTNVEECLSSLDDNKLPPLICQETSNWFQTKLVEYLKTQNQIKQFCNSMVDALEFETEPHLICEYLDFISRYIQAPPVKLMLNCSSLLIHRKKIVSTIFSYSNAKVKEKFSNSVLMLFSSYFGCLQMKLDLEPKTKEQDNDKLVYIRFSNSNKLFHIDPNIVYGLITILSYTYVYNWPGVIGLSKLFFSNGNPQFFSDRERKNPQPLFPDWLALRLLSSESEKLIKLILFNSKVEQLLTFLEYNGLSNIAYQKILFTLDKLNASDALVVKNANFDRVKLLNNLQIHWMKGVENGKNFAKVHLNYVGDVKTMDDADSETYIPPHKFKKSYEFWHKKEIVRIFKEKDFSALLVMVRKLRSNELHLKKKVLKLTLVEFDSNLISLANEIIQGDFNLLFNAIIKDVEDQEQHSIFLSEFYAIKKSLVLLKPLDKIIKDTTFWTCFNRFFIKESQKIIKKEKQCKKKVNSLKSFDELESFLKNFSFECNDKMQNQSWCETFKDLAIDKFYNKDTELNDENTLVKSMIFSRNRPYLLLSLLCKSNFSTLNKCVDYVLDGSVPLNASAVLDFLTICINSKRLAIKFDDENLIDEDLLQLKNQHIRKLIHFVIVENDIPRRIELVLNSCCTNSYKTSFVISVLKSYTNDDSKEKIAADLHTWLYLNIPYINCPQKLQDDHFKLIQDESCSMDKMTHNLITSFVFAEPNISTNPQLFRWWELAILKIAANHPLLFIRQLPMIPSLLSGKVNLLNYEVFKSLNLFNIFSKFINILRLLCPYLWDKNTKGLVPILDLYTDFFMSYYHLPRQRGVNDELSPILRKFLLLLDDWLKHDSDSANNWIKNHKHIFMELSLSFSSEQNSIRSIMSGLPLQNQTLLVLNCHNNLINLRNSQFNQDKLMSTLIETSKQANMNPEIAQYLLDELRTFYMNPSTCEVSLNLSMKALQYNPRQFKLIIGTYVRCLQSKLSNVSNASLALLPEFVLLSQEYRSLILKKVFEQAINGNSNALSALIESFRALKSQIGC